MFVILQILYQSLQVSITIEDDSAECHFIPITTKNSRKFKVGLIHHALMMMEFPSISTNPKSDNNSISVAPTLGQPAAIKLVRDTT